MITGGKLGYHKKVMNYQLAEGLQVYQELHCMDLVTEVENLKSENFQLSVFETESRTSHTNTNTEFRRVLYRFVHRKVTFHL